MTLITYLTRVHFADGVLEEALYSELEAGEKIRPLVMSEKQDANGEMAERLLSGIPTRSTPTYFHDVPHTADEKTARRIADIYNQDNCDVLVAFGSSKTIDLAKIVRIAIAHKEPLLTFAYARGGSRRIGENLPDLLALPGLFGFGAAVSAHASACLQSGEQALFMCKKLIPSVTICDPTLTIRADAAASASAGADAITHCVEAYLSKSYNPPAEGIALDGLKRAVKNLERVLSDNEDFEARREMMAASLNGALALQKGLGASHAISVALETVCARKLDHGTLNRITLPSVLRFNEAAVAEKIGSLRSVFDVHNGESLPDGVERYFSGLPLPSQLSQLGVSECNLEEAAVVAAHDLATGTNPRSIDEGDYLSIMKSVH